MLGPAEVAVTVGSSGYNEWFIAGEKITVSIQVPERGRGVVFSPEGTPVYDSILDEGDVFVPERGLIELIGEPG